MSAILWKVGSEERLRAFVIEQDKRFQSVMRAYLGIKDPVKPKRVRIVAPRPKALAVPVRDVLDLAAISPLLRRPVHWKIILEETCVAHQVTKSEILGPQREHRIVLARHEAMYRMKTETTMSLPQIGQRLGGKDHTTVLHGVRKHRERMEAAAL